VTNTGYAALKCIFKMPPPATGLALGDDESIANPVPDGWHIPHCAILTQNKKMSVAQYCDFFVELYTTYIVQSTTIWKTVEMINLSCH
jgi:hypothetical protein